MAEKVQVVSETPELQTKVSDDELRAAFTGPAVNSNKMYLSMMSAGARISFMEQHGDAVSPTFRTAVILSIQDALQLRDLLVRQLGKIEEAIMSAEVVSTEEKENGG